MNNRLSRLIHSITGMLQANGPEKTLQTEFDFGSPKNASLRIRLNLDEKNISLMLDSISTALASGAAELRLELIGPGILLHDHALMLFDELKKRPSTMALHVHSRTCLADGAILLWLAGDTRTIRWDAWIQLGHMPPLPSLAVHGDYLGAVQIAEEDPSATDLRTIMEYLGEWLPVGEIAGLRLFRKELEEMGLLNDNASNKQLETLFARGSSFSSPTEASSIAPVADSPCILLDPVYKTSRDQGH